MHRVEWDANKPFKNILIATDGSPGTDRTIEFISNLFFYSNFHLVSCVNTSRGDINPSLMLLHILEEHMKKGLERGSQILRRNGIEAHTALLRGNPPKLILKYMVAHDVDLLVLTRNPVSRVPSLKFGKVGDVLARRAPCPVLIVKGSPEPSIRKVLNPTDGKTDSIPAGKLAIALANHFNAEVTKFYVGEDESAGEEILTEAENAARRSGVSHVGRSQIVKGDPADNIIDIADGFDLIVMGKGNRSLFRRDLLCLTSREVVAVANCPVLLVG